MSIESWFSVSRTPAECYVDERLATCVNLTQGEKIYEKIDLLAANAKSNSAMHDSKLRSRYTA
jgi:hypothetical protein